ncbi:TPA: histidine--tRNA ligase [Candidatus Woesearchaeota archaeon]|nr:histidine--tRNA ligase [Candidatus Woesearchaeota archaeon]
MKPERARGTRDFAGREALLRQEIVATLRKVFELYGYSPLETPILEKFETLASKYAGGAEILKETFKLTDQGGRELGLRYDLTVPMCRFIATNPNLKMPFKRYQIGSVFRDGPLKIGRYREFAQCDVDIVGVKSMAADTEVVETAQSVFERLKLGIKIRVNNRKLLNGIIAAAAGIKTDKAETIILTLDKLEKQGKAAVEKELEEKGVAAAAIRRLMELITANGSNSEKLQKLEREINDNEGKKGLAELRQVLESLEDDTNVSFDPSLARGLAYYTGTVFEAFLDGNEKKLAGIKSAVAAGGRYDEMIGNFVGSGREYPAVGISFGLDIIQDILTTTGSNAKTTAAAVYVIPIKVEAEGKKIAGQLRKLGVNADVDMSNRDIKRNLEYAAAAGIPYAAFIGEKEVKEGKIRVRDMASGAEKLVALAEAANIIKGN